jgi:group I intron endonuclease
MDKVNGKKSPIYLYQYINKINGKSYIGITNNLIFRKRNHEKGKSGAIAFNRAMKKYGIETFEFKILAIFDILYAAEYHENAAIRIFKTRSPNGYNLTGGEPWCKYRGSMPEEVKLKISLANKGRKISPESIEKLKISLQKYWQSPRSHQLASDRQNGKEKSKETKIKIKQSVKLHHLSPEYRLAQSKLLKGRKLSQDQCNAISNGLKGKRHSEETKLKIKNSIILHHLDPKYRRICSERQKGRKLSPEKCKAISDRMKGKKYSIERRMAISKGMRKYFEHKSQPS